MNDNNSERRYTILPPPSGAATIPCPPPMPSNVVNLQEYRRRVDRKTIE